MRRRRGTTTALVAAWVASFVVLFVPAVDGADSSTLYVAPDGTDSAPCSQAAPCGSFDRAYQLATPGTVVEVGPGTYPRQLIRYQSDKVGGQPVVFRVLAGARLDIGARPGSPSSGLVVSGAHQLVFENLHLVGELRIVPTKTSATPDVRYPEGIVFKGGRIDGFFTIRGVNGVTFQGTTIGNYRLSDADPKITGVPIVGSYAGQPDARNLAFRNVRFENVVRPPGVRTHGECLFLDGGITGLTISSSTFTNCAVIDIFVFKNNGRAATDVLLQNNWLDAPRDSAGRFVGGAITFKEAANPQPPAERWRIRFNSLRSTIQFKCTVGNGCESAWRDVVVSSNVGWNVSGNPCLLPGTEGVTFNKNIWSGRACGDTDRRASLGFVGPDTFDFRLARRAAAIGFGEPDDAPAVDIHGRVRSSTFPPDAGAWQREPALVLPGRAIGSIRVGEPRSEVVKFYGDAIVRPTQRLENGDRIAVREYRIRGGVLRIGYRDDTVAWVSTTSSYYRTLRGLTPGVSPATASVKGKPQCRRRSTGLYVRPTQKRPARVAELTVTAPGLVPVCALPKP